MAVIKIWEEHANGQDLILNTVDESQYQQELNKPGSMPYTPGVNPYTGGPIDPNIDVIPISAARSQERYDEYVVQKAAEEQAIRDANAMAQAESDRIAIAEMNAKINAEQAKKAAEINAQRQAQAEADAAANAKAQAEYDAAEKIRLDKLAETRTYIENVPTIGELNTYLEQYDLDKTTPGLQLEEGIYNLATEREKTINAWDAAMYQGQIQNQLDEDKRRAQEASIEQSRVESENLRINQQNDIIKQQQKSYDDAVKNQINLITGYKVPDLLPMGLTLSEYKARQEQLTQQQKDFNSYLESLDLDKSTREIEVLPQYIPILEEKQSELNTAIQQNTGMLGFSPDFYKPEKVDIIQENAKKAIERAQKVTANLDLRTGQEFLADTFGITKALEKSKETAKTDTFQTGFQPLDTLTTAFKKGGTFVSEASKGIGGETFAGYAKVFGATEQQQAGAREAGRITAVVLPYLLAPELGIAASAAQVAESKSNEEVLTNIAFAAGLGAAGKLVKGAAGVVTPIFESAPTVSKVVSGGFKLVESAPTIYYGAETLIGGAGAVSSAYSGDIAAAEEFDRSLGVSLGTAGLGLKIGSTAVDVAYAAPKVAIQTGIELNKGNLLNPDFGKNIFKDVSKTSSTIAQIESVDVPLFNRESISQIKAAPSVSFFDITAPKYEFKQSVGTEAQIAAIESGKPVPLPQMRGLDALIKEAESGKAAKFAKETFDTAFEVDKPIVYRSSAYSLGEKPSGFNYEERGTYTAPALSTIGLRDIKSEGESVKSEFSLFPKEELKGKALIIQAEAISKLPTTKTFSNITAKDIINLRNYTGVDLAQLGEAKYTTPSGNIKAGESILETEISKITIGKGRPLKGRDIQMSITGEKYVTEVAPEVQKSFIEVKTKPGTITPSIPYTLGRGGEAEFLAYPAEGSVFERVQVAPRGKIRTLLNRPEAFFILEGKSVPIEGYKLKSKPKTPFELSKETKSLLDYEKEKYNIDLEKNIQKETLTRGTKIKYKSIIDPRYVTNVITSPTQKISRTTPSVFNKISIVPTYTEYRETFKNYPGYNPSKPYTTYKSTDISIGKTTPSRNIYNLTDISYSTPTTKYTTTTKENKDIISYPEISRATTKDVISYPKISRITDTDIISYPEPTKITRKNIISYPEPSKITSRDIISYPKSSSIIYPTESIKPYPTEPSRPTPRTTTTLPPTIPSRTTIRIPPYTTVTQFPRSTSGSEKRSAQSIRSYNVYLRKGVEPETGKKRKIQEVLVGKNLPYNVALNAGLPLAAEYAQRSVVLRPSRTRSIQSDIGPVSQSLLGQFRSPVGKTKINKGRQGIVFIEKSKYAINTPEEKKGIPYKAAKLARARKNQFGSFGRMKI